MGQLSPQQLRDVLDYAPVGLALCTFTGENLYVNREYARIVGYTPEETLALRYWDVTPQEYWEKEVELLQDIKEKGEYGPFFKHYIDRSQRLVPVRLQLKRFEFEGAPCIWTVVERAGRPHKTARSDQSSSGKSDQRRLREFSPEVYRRLFDEAPVGFAVCVNGVRFEENREFRRIGNPLRVGMVRIPGGETTLLIDVVREHHESDIADPRDKRNAPLEALAPQYGLLKDCDRVTPAHDLSPIAVRGADSAEEDDNREVVVPGRVGDIAPIPHKDLPLPERQDPITSEEGKKLAAEIQRSDRLLRPERQHSRR